MSAAVDFYLDFPSGYSYIAAHRIGALAAAHGRSVEWRVISLPHVFKATGYPAPMSLAAKWRYAMLDWHRSCEAAGLPHVEPAALPLDAKLARIAFWSLAAEDAARAREFALAVISRYWGAGEEVRTAEQIARACAPLGLDTAEIERRAADPMARDRLVAETARAIEIGVFGAPFFVVAGEPFWGADRLAELDRRLGYPRDR
jgi:2-hydroxychromene-2-carboxylate isomerase